MGYIFVYAWSWIFRIYYINYIRLVSAYIISYYIIIYYYGIISYYFVLLCIVYFENGLYMNVGLCMGLDILYVLDCLIVYVIIVLLLCKCCITWFKLARCIFSEFVYTSVYGLVYTCMHA